jgi:NAD(P)-dependent dehydrogenase (short-subunit alcohol dehydrogenase family)
MTGKTVVITGGNSGIGLAAAEALAGVGAKVVITARDAHRGRVAVQDIGQRSGSSSVELVVFDLSVLASVRSGAQEILGRYPRIDVLVNNAGIVLSERRLTPDGLEETFAVNHLGPFLLTGLLLDRLEAGAPARVVNVASTAHKGARHGLDFDDLQSERHYSAMPVYSKSKLANIYFTTELARRLAGTGVTANCLHPGTVATGYGRDGDTKGAFALGLKLSKPFFLSPEKGARTSVYVASAPELAEVTGQYFVRCRAATPSKVAQDPRAALRLWEASEKLIAEHGGA